MNTVSKDRESSIFFFYKSKALEAASDGRQEEALRYAYEAARMAFLSGLGLKESILFDFELDNMLSNLGLVMREQCGSAGKAFTDGKSIGFIASELWDIGGHCEALLQWAGCLRNQFDKQYLYLTNVSGVPPDFVNLERSLRGLGVEISCLPYWGPYCRRAGLLAEQIQRDSPRFLALFIHPQDVITISALSSLERKPTTLLFNHTDRNFWLGRNVIDYLVDWRKAGADFSARNRRIFNSCVIPLTTDIKPRYTANGFLGIPDDSTISLSVGYFYKITCDDDYDYFGTIERLLARYPNHYHLLVTNESRKGEINSYLGADEAIRRRFIVNGLQADLTPYYGAADFVIETFPNIGGTIRTEAMACAKPIVTFRNKKMAMLSETDALDSSYQYVCETEEEVIENSSMFIENPALRTEVGEKLHKRYLDCFSPERTRERLNSIFAGRKEPSVVEPVVKYKIGDLVKGEHLIYEILEIGDNHQVYLAYSRDARIPLLLKVMDKKQADLIKGKGDLVSRIGKWTEISPH
ncbi:MAG: glycosyltransferase, partial [Actinobacteria bacterium]|nr:glycosyltransferase [Actinomycetota bacterium]